MPDYLSAQNVVYNLYMNVPNSNTTINRRRLAAQVRANIVTDFGAANLLRVHSEHVARAIIDGYVLRLISQWDDAVGITRIKIDTLRTDAAALILFDLPDEV